MDKIELNNETRINYQQIRRGDIYCANMINTYNSHGEMGSEFEKVLVIQNDKGNRFSTTTIVLLIKNGIVDIKSMNTIDKRRLINKIGEFSAAKMIAINIKLVEMFTPQSEQYLEGKFS